MTVNRFDGKICIEVKGVLLKVSDVAKYLGVSISTMHRWEREGKIKPSRTPGGQRRYETDDLMRFKGKSTTQKYTIAYARVSSSDQKDDLERQKVNLENIRLNI